MFLRKRAIGSAIFVGILAAGGFAEQALAQVVTGSIPGSGVNADLATTFQRDSNWRIVALPAGTVGLPSTPYQAYVPRTVNAQTWLGANTGINGSQGGYSSGGSNYYWIAPSQTVTGILTASQNDPATWYNWIAAYDFTVPADDNYYLNFPSAVDNRLGYFINGTIDTTNPRRPVIVGGTQIGTTSDAAGQFRQISNNAGGPVFLAAGTTHTAYMVLTDLGTDTGVLIGPSVFSTIPVPEPSAAALVAAGVGGVGLLAFRRRFSRK